MFVLVRKGWMVPVVKDVAFESTTSTKYSPSLLILIYSASSSFSQLNMLHQPPYNSNLFPLFIFVFWSCWILNGVVSDPQTNLLRIRCNPYDGVVTNASAVEENLNMTFQDIRGRISEGNKHFATAAKEANGAPVYTIFQCRNYMSIGDCVLCFDVAAYQIRGCTASKSSAAIAVYDGCFIRYNSNGFFDEAPQPFNTVSCGNQTTGEAASTFNTTVEQVLMNLQRASPRIPSLSAATKIVVPHSNGAMTIYAYAQCVETATMNKCLDCLKVDYSSLEICLPNSDGIAFDYSCFMRYSITPFFPTNRTIDITLPSIKRSGSSNKMGSIVGELVGSIALVLILLGLLYAWIMRHKKNETSPREDITGASKLKGPINYRYSDLMLATNNFSEENKLGEGGFGVVYKGTLKNGKLVAVKKMTLRNSSRRMDEDFESEVTLINNVHHRNLVRLLGCCCKGPDRILVYEYMKNNSLENFLFGERRNGFLNWKQRYDVILGMARGLRYLHEEFHIRIIHRDIKTNNILLDDDLQPKIADFGLARLLPDDKSHLSTRIAGTLGYTAPEYAIHGQLTVKADIYSYGVVVLEIISSQKCTKLRLDRDEAGAFLIQTAWKLYEKDRHLELVDKALDPNEYDEGEVKKVIEIGLLCIQASADERPMMSEVVALLQNKDLLENLRPSRPILIEIN